MYICIKLLDTYIEFNKKYIYLNTIKKINNNLYLTNYNNLLVKIINEDSDSIFNEISLYNKLKKFNNNYPDNIIKYIGLGVIIKTSNLKKLDKHILFLPEFNKLDYKYKYINDIPMVLFNNYEIFIIKLIHKILNINFYFEKNIELYNIGLEHKDIGIYKDNIIITNLNIFASSKYKYINNTSNSKLYPYGYTNIKYIPNYVLGKIINIFLFNYKKLIIDLDKNISTILNMLFSKKYTTKNILDFVITNHKDILDIN